MRPRGGGHPPPTLNKMRNVFMHDDITDVPGLRVGHAEDTTALTGCTAILCESGAVAGMDLRGMASGTRQADSLSVLHAVEKVHAIFLTGGSAFGLDAAAGVMSYLEGRGVGLITPFAAIPIVPTAVIFDLSLGDPHVRPTPEMAREACLAATAGPVPQGSVGAGTGASVGKYHGIGRAMKGGLGSASVRGAGDVVVGALAVVNAFGDVIEPSTGEVLAGLRDAPEGRRLARTSSELRQGVPRQIVTLENTTLVVVATNVMLSKPQATKVAQMAQVGLARTISPAHSPQDGDVVFCLSLGESNGDLHHVGALAQEATSLAIVRAVKSADGFGVIPAWKDIFPSRLPRRP